MYAVIKTGGKQYRVAKDDVITVERLDRRSRARRSNSPKCCWLAAAADIKVGSAARFGRQSDG